MRTQFLWGLCCHLPVRLYLPRVERTIVTASSQCRLVVLQRRTPIETSCHNITTNSRLNNICRAGIVTKRMKYPILYRPDYFGLWDANKQIHWCRTFSCSHKHQKRSSSPPQGIIFETDSELLEDEIEKSIKAPKTVFTIVDYIKEERGIPLSNEDNAVSLVKFLIKEKIPPQHIAEGLKAKPDLIDKNLDMWETALTLVRDYGFKDNQVMPVVYAHNKLFQGKAEKLYEIGETLRRIGFRDGALHKVITKCPELLSMKSKQITNRYNELLRAFKKVEIVYLILESPNLLIDQWEDIKEVRDYVSEEMGIGYAAMAKCNIFNYSLLHVQTRHMCLMRLGYYQVPDPKGIILNENASLKQIVQYGNKSYAKKLAKISLEEYQAFAMMMEIEMKEQDELLRKYGGVEEDDYSDSDDSESEGDAY